MHPRSLIAAASLTLLAAGCPQGVPLDSADGGRVVAFEDLSASITIADTTGAPLPEQRLIQVAFSDRGAGRAARESLHTTVDDFLEAVKAPWGLIPLEEPAQGGVALSEGVHVYADVGLTTIELAAIAVGADTAYIAMTTWNEGPTRIRVEDHSGGAPWLLWQTELAAPPPFAVSAPEPEQQVPFDDALEVTFDKASRPTLVQVLPAGAPCLESVSDNVDTGVARLGPPLPTAETEAEPCDAMVLVTQHVQVPLSDLGEGEALHLRSLAVPVTFIPSTVDHEDADEEDGDEDE